MSIFFNISAITSGRGYIAPEPEPEPEPEPTGQLHLIVEIGQSNMEGRHGDTANPAYPFSSTNGYWFNGTTQFNIVTNRGNASGGSQANYFAEKYFELTGNKAVMLEAAQGGTGLTSTASSPHWGSGSSLRGAAQTLINQAKTYYEKTAPFAALWSQGERDAQEMDANPAYTKAIVKTAMQSVIDWWKGLYPNAPFLISELGDRNTSDNSQGWQDMRAIQNEIVSENSGVYMAFTGAKNFGAQGKMIDSLHYNYVGYKEMGEAFAIKLTEVTT